MNKIHASEETATYQPLAATAELRWDDSVRHIVVSELARLPAEAWLDWIRADQRQRWLKGYRISIERYLELAPLADADREQVIDLIYSEYILQQEVGVIPSPDDYLRRFPKFEAALRRLLAIDQALLPVESLPTINPLPRQASAARLQTVGKYPILGVLAEGGQGIVFRALHPTLGKEVIIKWSKQQTRTDERDHLLTEGQLLARIDHPDLVRVFDLDFHEGRPFLVMERVDAVNLEQYRERSHPTPRRAAALVARIARALDAIHRKGIVHRDVKPKNVLVDEHDRPKLIDFGLACWQHSFADGGGESSSISGTLAYIAHEQARGEEANIGPRSDVFGLGGLLHFLLTGAAPYAEKDLPTLYKAATKGAWNRARLDDRSIPARLRAICMRAMAPDSKHRYASALEMADDLDAYLQRPRKIALASAALAAGLVIVALTGWALTYTPDEKPPNKDLPIAQEKEAPLAPSNLQIDVVRGRKGPFPLADAVPVLTNSELRFTIALPAKRVGTLFHFSECKWSLVATYAAEASPRDVSYPLEAATRVPLKGEPGPELFLFCARKGEPITLGVLQSMVGTLPAFPHLPQEQTLFTFNEKELRSWHRGGLGAPVKSKNPEDLAHAQLEQIRLAVRSQCDVYAGVLFVHKEAED